MRSRLSKLIINTAFNLLVFVSLLLLPASFALAADAIQFTPQISIPGFATGAVDVGTTNNGMMTSDLLARYIKAIYDYGLKAAGILAAVILMGGGLLWLTSAGNESKIGQAKEMIVGAISGLVILFSAWLILNTVNPELLKLTPMSLAVVTGDSKICCEENGIAYMKNETKCTGTKYPGYIIDNTTNKCAQTGCCFRDSFTVYTDTVQGYCIDTFKNRCNTNAVFKPGENCSNLEICKKTTISQMDCKGIPDGKRCNNDGGIRATCYSGVCYLNPSKHDEPCGDEGGRCMTNTECSGQYSERDLLGGNDCSSGFKCCITSTW